MGEATVGVSWLPRSLGLFLVVVSPLAARAQPDPFVSVAPTSPGPAAPPRASVPPPPPSQAAPRPSVPPPPRQAAPAEAPSTTTPRPQARPAGAPTATAERWAFQCPAAGTVVEYSDGVTFRWLGADPREPLICLSASQSGPYPLVLGVMDAGPSPTGLLNAARQVLARGIGGTAQGQSQGQGANNANVIYDNTLTIERFEAVSGPFGRADAVIVSRRQVGTGGNFHQSVQRFVIDRRTGVALRRQVELIAGTTAARNREVLRITPPGGRP